MANKDKIKDQSKYSWQRFWMDLGRIVLIPYYLVLRMKCYDLNKCKYSKKLRGGALVLANHSSFCDPFYVGRAFWYRRMYFMAADVVMKNPFIRVLLTGMGCVSINRESYDIQAIKKIIALAKGGQTVAIFPQGTVDREHDMQQIKNGALLIALQAGVPLVPIYTHKRKSVWEQQVTVIGEPLVIEKKMPSMAEINQYSEELLSRMKKCNEVYKEIMEEKKHA